MKNQNKIYLEALKTLDAAGSPEGKAKAAEMKTYVDPSNEIYKKHTSMFDEHFMKANPGHESMEILPVNTRTTVLDRQEVLITNTGVQSALLATEEIQSIIPIGI